MEKKGFIIPYIKNGSNLNTTNKIEHTLIN